MSGIVYFHIDELARDAVVAANLKPLLKQNGIDLVYGNRSLSKRLHKLNSMNEFSLYIFPGVDHLKSYVPNPESFTAPVIILPTESIGGTGSDNPSRLLAKFLGSDPEECEPWIDKVAAFCLWGSSRLKMVAAEVPDLVARCHVVGHPRHDHRCQGKGSRPNKPSGKIRVGLISRFIRLNVFDRRGMLEFIYGTREDTYSKLQLSPGREIEDQVYIETLDLRVLFDLIKRLDAEEHDLYIRVHPREDRVAWQELIDCHDLPVALAPWDQPFMHWLQEVDHVVGPPSTSFYDCVVAGKVPISTSDIVMHRNDHLIAGSDDENLILRHVRRPESIEELVEMLSSQPEDEMASLPEEAMSLLRGETNYPASAHALDALANICRQVIQSDSGERRYNILNRIQVAGLSFAVSTAKSLSQAFGRRGPEQSSSFRLTRKRKRFIDGLGWAG